EALALRSRARSDGSRLLPARSCRSTHKPALVEFAGSLSNVPAHTPAFPKHLPPGVSVYRRSPGKLLASVGSCASRVVDALAAAAVHVLPLDSRPMRSAE